MPRRATTVAEVAVLEPGDRVIRSSDSEVTAFIALTDGTVFGDQLLAIGDTVVLDDDDTDLGSVAQGRCLRVAVGLR